MSKGGGVVNRAGLAWALGFRLVCLGWCVLPWTLRWVRGLPSPVAPVWLGLCLGSGGCGPGEPAGMSRVMAAQLLGGFSALGGEHLGAGAGSQELPLASHSS